MVSSCDDDSIIVYDCDESSFIRAIQSKKYGAGLIQYTHHPETVIHSSTKEDDTIRHLSLTQQENIGNFNGHTDKVVAISMSPVSDTFLSGSLDKTVRR